MYSSPYCEGGDIIEIELEFVEAAIKKEFIDVTSQVAGISLECEEKRHKRIEKPRSAVVMSKGIFKSKVVCVFSRRFEEAVLVGMNGGREVDSRERQAYFKEYLNICFGRFISQINNHTGKASRFVIPVIIDGMYRESGIMTFDHKVELSFTGIYGPVRLTIDYEVLPEHSSN